MAAAADDGFASTVAEASAPARRIQTWKVAAGLLVGCACVALKLRGIVLQRSSLQGRRLSDVTEVKLQHFFSLGPGTVCRANDQEDRMVLTLPKHGQVKEHMMKEQCRRECQAEAQCAGYEFRKLFGRCELWYEHIGAHIHVFHNKTVDGPPDFECVLKSPTCSDLWSHQAIFVRAMIELQQFVDFHCAEGPEWEEYAVCSRSYVEAALRTEKLLCTAVSESCRRPVCTEEAASVSSSRSVAI
eukprot:TRINITY_DN83234_c0_g1_i1.p1 TRINITY_DN83234_c0_g1~~TRINITY_DN83234_c0_g1_i1.p1  ORF type:complete len:243 (-),score=59.77 TRINITY_DN83234_c0_g1_i1:21-749(-)